MERNKNNEWIPITEGLPALGKCVIVTVKDHIRKKLELRYPVYYLEHADREGYGFYLGDIGNILLPEVSEVIAWMPIPKPYDLDWSD